MKQIHVALLASLLLFLLALTASAHAGKTDGSGGHYNNATGSYHYHHGYPAHQHTGGRCPYDFSDKTGQSSGSPSSGSSFSDSSSGSSFSDSSSGTSSSGHFSSSDDFSAALTWLLLGATVIFVIATIASSVKSKKEDKARYAKEREQAEQAEREREKKKKALKEEEERQKREAEARAKREQEEKLRKLHETYDGKHILSLVNIPDGSEIGPDNLPREIGAKSNWGDTYTFFATKGGSFHTRDCRYARYGQAINALTIDKDRHPCKLCDATLPPLEWAREYRKIKNLSTAYGLNVDFTPPPSWYPPFVVCADQNTLSRNFISSLDPTRVMRALQENFIITEREDGKSTKIVPEGKTEGYETSFARCTCPDNSIRHAVCKHMIALALHKGVLEIKQNKLPK